MPAHASLPDPGPVAANAADIPSPALLLVLERIDENLRRMVRMAGSPERLRPHVKTHKLAQLVRRQLDLGITRFKCATIAEAEMTARAGAPDVLLALQPVGPNLRRVAELAAAFPGTRLATLVDDPAIARDLGRLGEQAPGPLEVYVDLDVGQHRTGIAPGPEAEALVAEVAGLPGLVFGGLHAYDGHLHDPDPAERRRAADAAFAPVEALARRCADAGRPVPRIVAGGTPTFPFHALRPGPVECSPGTCVLWDAGYARKLPDLVFEPAAILLSRVVSRPARNRLCLDLGHKAVASEMPHPRVVFPALPEAVPVAHNEEHLVLETPDADRWRVGDVVYGIPWHVCPTVALHAEVWAVENGVAGSRWPVEARARRLTL